MPTREEILKELADEAAALELKKQASLTQLEDITPQMSEEAYAKACKDVLEALGGRNG